MIYLLLPLNVGSSAVLLHELVPCHHSMAHLQTANGDFQIWKVAMNILSKEPWKASKGLSSSLKIGCMANNLKKKKKT